MQTNKTKPMPTTKTTRAIDKARKPVEAATKLDSIFRSPEHRLDAILAGVDQLEAAAKCFNDPAELQNVIDLPPLFRQAMIGSMEYVIDGMKKAVEELRAEQKV